MQKTGMIKQIIQGPGLALARRNLSTTTVGPGHTGNKAQGVFSSFFEPRQIQVQDASHSQRLSAKEEIVEIQTHNVKSDCRDQYIESHRKLCQVEILYKTFFLVAGTQYN
jgi:hypothetical protein